MTFIEQDGTQHIVAAEEGARLMQCALDHMVPGIVADCGGCCSCATCHAYIDARWLPVTGEAGEDERLMLEAALEPQPNSRLTCQILMRAELDGLVVYLPTERF